jgi:hypothetical protein
MCYPCRCRVWMYEFKIEPSQGHMSFVLAVVCFTYPQSSWCTSCNCLGQSLTLLSFASDYCMVDLRPAAQWMHSHLVSALNLPSISGPVPAGGRQCSLDPDDHSFERRVCVVVREVRFRFGSVRRAMERRNMERGAEPVAQTFQRGQARRQLPSFHLALLTDIELVAYVLIDCLCVRVLTFLPLCAGSIACV